MIVKKEDIKIKKLDHLGIVAGIIIEHLLGEGIKAEELNDDKLGRTMDKMYRAGLSKIFLITALDAIKKYQINTKYSHLDSTSLHLHREYKTDNTKKEREIIKENPIHITQGYSRDHKQQQSCERGFRFIKDPLFFADSLFVKNPERVETMMVLMGLCLLVYSIGQRQLRLSLQRSKAKLKNQLGKLTTSPTLRWIFQCFQGVHVLMIQGIKQIINLSEERQRILRFFSDSCQNYYLIS